MRTNASTTQTAAPDRRTRAAWQSPEVRAAKWRTGNSDNYFVFTRSTYPFHGPTHATYVVAKSGR